MFRCFSTADEVGIRADLHDGLAALPDGEEEPSASACEQQDENNDDIPESLLHGLPSSSMNWVRYSHFADALQGEKPSTAGSHEFLDLAGHPCYK